MKKFIVLIALICGFLVSNSQSYTYIAQRYRWLAGLFEALGLPAGDSAQFKTGQRQQAGAVYYDSTGLDAGFYIWTGTAWVLQGTAGAADLPDGLIQPGYVTYSGTGLKFYITPSLARFDGIIYATDYDSVTLSPSDPTFPRKDVIYVSIAGIGVKTGVPAGPAAEPQMDAGQIKLTVVDLQAGASVPTITTNIIYDENTGESVVTNVGTTTDPDNTEAPYHLTKAVEFTNIDNLDAGIFTLPSTVDLTPYDGISMFIRLKAVMHATARIYVTFFNGSTAISNEVLITINKNSLTYQGLTVPMSLFTLTNAFADKIRIRWYQSSPVVHPGFYLDYVHWESGVTQPGGGSTPMAIGAINSKLPTPNGAVIENNVFYNQTASQTYPGLLSAPDKTKLDSLKYNYFIQNGNGLGFVVPLNDSTVLIYGFEAGTGVTIDTVDRKVVISSTGGTTIYSGDGNLAGNRRINGSGHTFQMDSIPSYSIFTGNDFVALGIGSALQMGDSVSSLTGSSATDFSTIQVTPTKIKFIPYDGLGSVGDVWTNLGNGEGHWATGGGGGGPGISLTTVGSSGPASLVGTVLNVPDYSSGSTIWNGTVIGTTFSATSATINNGAVQWTFTGSSPATFTLPARTSSVNQFYTIKNIGSADLTVAAAGTDDIFTTTTVASLIVVPGGSVMVTGAANGTSDLWTALFHTTGSAAIDTAYLSRTFGGVPMAYVSGSTLVLKDLVGASPMSVTTLTDSTNQINFNVTGTPTGGKFLRDDYSWQTPGGGSTVEVSSSWFVDTLKINGSAASWSVRPDVIYDEFLSAQNTASGSLNTSELAIGTGTDAAIGNTLGSIPTHSQGWMVFQTGSTSTGLAAIATTSTTQARLYVDTTKTYRFETVVRLPVLSAAADSFRVTAGFTVYTTNYTVASNDIHFRYSHGHNSGAWTCYNNNTGGSGQATNTAVTVSANTDYRLGIEFDGEQILFYINGTLVATHTSALPAQGTSMMFPVVAITKTGGSTGTTNMFMYADWLKYRKL